MRYDVLIVVIVLVLAALAVVFVFSPSSYPHTEYYKEGIYKHDWDETQQYVVKIDGKELNPSENQLVQKQLNYVKECMEKFPISREEIFAARNTDVPSSGNTKCLLSCILVKQGMIKKDYIDWDMSKSHQRTLHSDPEIRKRYDAMYDTCKQEVVPDFTDMCKLGGAIVDCVRKYSKEFNLDRKVSIYPRF